MKHMAFMGALLVVAPYFALEPQAIHATRRGPVAMDWLNKVHSQVANPGTPRIVYRVQANNRAAIPVLMHGANRQMDDAALNALLKRKGDIAYGEYLAGQCTACHTINANRKSGEGVPVIAGKQRNAILSALYAYKVGKKKSEVMQQIASTLEEEDMAALAEYFSQLP